MSFYRAKEPTYRNEVKCRRSRKSLREKVVLQTREPGSYIHKPILFKRRKHSKRRLEEIVSLAWAAPSILPAWHNSNALSYSISEAHLGTVGGFNIF